MNFRYQSIKHKRMILREETVADSILQVLDEVKKRLGKNMIISCEKGVLVIRKRGYNSTVYSVNYKENALSQNTRVTMDGMITKVAIYREQESESSQEKPPKK